MPSSVPGRPANPSEADASNEIGFAILAALENWDANALARAVERDPAHPNLSHIFVKGLQGTPHYRALDYAILMSNSGANFEHAVLPAVACSRVLLANAAPVYFLSSAPAAASMVFFDTDWSDSSMASVLQQLLREYIESGVVRPNEPLPRTILSAGYLRLLPSPS